MTRIGKSPKKRRAKRRVVDLVTGATSGVGLKLVRALLDMGHEVRVIIRDHPSQNSEWKSLPPNVKPYRVNLAANGEAERDELMLACKGVDNLFHLAGASYNHKFTYNMLININVIATENVLNAYVKANKGKRLNFIYAGSATVYGYRRGDELLTEDSELKPASKYSMSKVLAEQVIRSFASVNKNLRYTIMRFGVFYGEEYRDSFFKIFKIIREGRMVYIGDGNNYLTLIHVDDAVRSLVMSINDKESNIYNVVEPQRTVRELVEMAAREICVSPPKRSMPYIVGKITRGIMNINVDEFDFIASNRVVSTNKIKENLGFVPQNSIIDYGKSMVDEFISTQRIKRGNG